jgi:NTP pyrophosphatase (non-canonical NTP hydrolase)
MNFEEVEKKVIEWANDRNFFTEDSGSSEYVQIKKLGEEFVELIEGIYEEDLFKIKDSIGDMMVVMAIIAEFVSIKSTRINLIDCFNLAYNQIKDRKGKMVDGIFVKE